ncbi:MAG: fibronectin type III domain-containing protein [Bacteroidales bacterium]|nr:fibronectin type III domain-containing protein [Bacteroidales bacterium]
MKKLLSISGMIFFLIIGSISLNAQSLTVPPGTLVIGPVLIGQSSADGAHSFTVTGSGYSANAELYADSYDSRFTISLTGTSGSYGESLIYNADGSGNVNQTIYVKYTPTTIGFVDLPGPPPYMGVELWDLQSATWQYKEVRGIGLGPEILMQGREQSPDTWLEIVSGSTTPAVNQGTDFGDALASIETVDRTYQITNTKTGGYAGNLVLDEYAASQYVQISGANADQFSVQTEPISPVAPNSGTTTYTIRFEPTSAGVKTATVTIGNNDPNEDPYTFSIQGEGTIVLPDAPTANAATNIDNNNFWANWTVGGGGITQGYYLDVATDMSFTSFVSGYNNKDVGLVTTYNVTGLDPNTDYYFRVRAYNAGGTSASSNTQSLTTAPAVPVTQPATNIGTNSFYANWLYVAGATSYKLDVNTQSNFGGTIILSNEDVTNEYRFITGLTGGTTYYYRVRSYNGNSSENSSVVSVKTICNAPVATAATGVTQDEFTANWNAPAGGAPDFYKLDVSISNTFNSFVFGYENLTVYGTSEVVTGLDPNTVYYYRVRAVNVSGNSAYSNTINTTTFAGGSTTWTGAVSSNWFINGNWTDGVPYSTTNVTIAAAGIQPILTSNAACNNLTLDPLSEFTVANGTTLTVNGNFLMQASSSGQASLVEYGGLNVTGTQKVRQYLTENRWHFVSSPVDGAVSNVFNDIYLKYYDEPNSEWVYIVDLGVSLPAGVGYEAWSDDAFNGNTFVLYQGGDLNSGSVGLPVSNSGDGWNLVGNPYPSSIDWDNAGWTKTNIDGSVYVWDGVQYLTWNGSVGALANGVIPAMQSFFVKANAASPDLQVDNAARVHGPDAYKGGGVNNLIEVSIIGNGYSDVTYVNFNENATAGFDSQFDSYKLFGIEEAPQIYSVLDDEILSVNVMDEFNPGMVIPLGIKTPANGSQQYTIKVSNLTSFDTPINVYIEDLYTGDFIQLDDFNEYTFSSDKADPADRFALHFMTATTGIDDINSGDLYVYANERSVYINNDPNNLKTGTVSVFNISGQEVMHTELQPVAINKFDLQVEPGYYVVKVLTNNTLTTQKVFIK